MELNFTPRHINEIEVEYKGRSFIDVMSDFTLKSLATFVKKGMNLKTDEEAFDAIGKYFQEEEGDLLKLMVLIARRLQEGGFLPRKINLEDLEKDLEAKMAEAIPTV